MMRLLLPILTFSILLSCKPQGENQEAVLEAAVETIAPTYDWSDLSVDFIMGKFDPSKDDRFEPINGQHADREGMLIQKETYVAFKKMYDDALSDGVTLQIRSATRNFDYQKGIWERKWTGKTKIESNISAATIADHKDRALNILKYSSMPGSSRHHWGTDIDLNSFENSWFEKGEGLKIYTWLQANADKYGFCQPYSAKGPDRPDGYNEERWHWSYTPLSDRYTAYAKEHLSDNMISGFAGADKAPEIGVKEKYILGINHDCK